MDRQPVKSSNIRTVGYDPSGATLEIEFQDGAIYQFSSIPQHIFDGIIAAASPGRFFHLNVRDRFPTVRLR